MSVANASAIARSHQEMSEAVIIFKDLPATFPEKDKIQKTFGDQFGALSRFIDCGGAGHSAASAAVDFRARTVDHSGVADRTTPSSATANRRPACNGSASSGEAAGPTGDARHVDHAHGDS
jgi:hypothetical protein